MLLSGAVGRSPAISFFKWFRNTLKSISFQITSRKNQINLKRYRLSNRLLQCPVLRCSISHLSFSRLRDSRSFNLTQLCAGRFYENRLVAGEVVERQLNHNMTFQVAVQKLTSLGVKFEILVTKGSPSYFKSRANGWYIYRNGKNPRTIMNGAYSCTCIFDTDTPGPGCSKAG